MRSSHLSNTVEEERVKENSSINFLFMMSLAMKLEFCCGGGMKKS